MFAKQLQLAILSLAAFPSLVFSQTTTATLVGSVLDGQNRAVVNAVVRGVNTATGFKRETLTNGLGKYVLTLLPIGTYRLDVEATGFAPKTLETVPLEIDRVVRLNVTIQPGAVVERVTVEAPVPVVETETGARGTILDNRRIVELPLNGRQFLELAKLTPGVTQNAGGSLRSELTGNLAGPNITVYGARESDNYYSIDGVSANDRFYNSPTVLPSVDAIQEFKVLSSTYAADTGGQGGASINLSIKSGGDAWHGSVFHFLRNNRLDARNTFDLLDRDGDGEAEIPGFQQNQFGATAGGPVQKGKTFLFASYEGLRIRKSVTQLQTLPTAAMRAGDFRGLGVRVLDPLTGQDFPTPNLVPAARVDPTARLLVNLIPMPNRPGASQNYVAQPEERNTANQGALRLDRNYSERDRVYGRFLAANTEGFLPFGTRSVLGTVRAAVPGFGNTLTLNSRNAALGWTRAFSPRMIGELRLRIQPCIRRPDPREFRQRVCPPRRIARNPGPALSPPGLSPRLHRRSPRVRRHRVHHLTPQQRVLGRLHALGRARPPRHEVRRLLPARPVCTRQRPDPARPV